ncbi:pentapeptide repeat-containing protein [Clostridium butyricum]
MSNIKGFKVFKSDWTCKGYQYEVGKTFKHNGNIELCGSGFHFCQKASDCFNYYGFDSSNKVAEVLATGLVESSDDKSVTDELIIVREIPWTELLTIVNEGKDCTGLCNTGDRNTGDWNTGDCNTGDCNTGNWNTGNRNTGNWNTGNWNTGDRNTGNRNTGDRNTGDWNTGDRNTGDWNTGDCNTGDRNTGDCNTGDCNTGDCNTADFSTGVFCAQEEKIKIFDKQSDLTYGEWMGSRARNIIYWNMETAVWVYEENMSAEEKEQYPTYKTTGGYLKVFSYKEAWSNLWNNLTDSEKQEIKNIPNFDSEKFEYITGIKVENESLMEPEYK